MTTLYVCILFGIFVVQFTKGKTFSSVIGTMTVSGRHEIIDGKQHPLLPLHIVANGLNFYLSEQNTVLAANEDEELTSLEVLSYENMQNGFAVRCSDSVSVLFTSETRGDIDFIRVSANIPQTFEYILIPWKITQNARIEHQNGKPFVKYRKKRYEFSEDFYIDGNISENTDNQIPYVKLSRAEPIAIYKTYISSKGLTLENLVLNPAGSLETYTKTLEDFTSAALSSFKTATAAKKYTEKLLTAYIAEMGNKGMYRAAMETVPAQTISKELKTYISSPFYNNLIESYASLAKEEKEERIFLNRVIAEQKKEIFEFPNLIPFLLYRESSIIIGDLEKIMEKMDTASFTPLQAAGLLEISLDFAKYYPEKENIFEKNSETCERKIKEALLLIDEQLYLSADNETINSEDTLRIAKILMRYGTTENNIWEHIGRMLITSLMRFSGEAASLPARFTLTGEATTGLGLMVDDSKILTAADLYPLLITDNTWYPHIEPLTIQSEKGIWAWTCAQSIQITENTRQKLTIKVQFPMGETHYAIICGIQPFQQIQIYGRDFRSDPRFEMYNSSGYVYNAAAKTLFLKLKHKTEYEDIVLFFGGKPTAK